MKKHYRHENDCANCGVELNGKFCHACGQENLELKENFGHMLNHAVSDYFHFDHQFFNTLKPLLLSPGKLTNEYMAGKRVRYLHPVKMYIFISLVYFLLLFQSNFEPVKISHRTTTNDKKELILTNKKLDSLTKDPRMPGLAKSMMLKAKDKNEAIIKTTDNEEKDITKGVTKAKKKTHIKFWGGDLDYDAHEKDTTYEQYLASQAKLSPDKKDGFLSRYTRKREYELDAGGKDVKEILLEGVKHNTPKMMFLLLPLFALLLKITFWRNKKFYVEHLIYSFHFHCFLFLFLTIIMLLKMAIPDTWGIDGWLNTFAVFAIMWYIFKSLRTVYHRTAKRTISKMIGLAFSYTIIFSFCMTLLVIIVALFD